MGASCSCLFGKRDRLEALSQVQEKSPGNFDPVSEEANVGETPKCDVAGESKNSTSVPVTPAIVAPVPAPVKAVTLSDAPPTTAKEAPLAPAIEPAKTLGAPAQPCAGSDNKDENVAAENGKQAQERPADVTKAAGEVEEEEETEEVGQEAHSSGKKKKRRRKKGKNSKQASAADNLKAQVGAGSKNISGKATVE